MDRIEAATKIVEALLRGDLEGRLVPGGDRGGTLIGKEVADFYEAVYLRIVALEQANSDES